MLNFTGRFKTRHYILVGACLLITAIILTSVATVNYLREQEVDLWKRQLSDLSLVLADQTSQSMLSVEITLDSIVEKINLMGIRNSSELVSKTKTSAFFDALQDKITGLPQVDVATIVAANGDVINFTRSFPAPNINLSDRDYFKAHLSDSKLGIFLSVRVQNKGNGKWVFYLSRRLNDVSGRFIGLALIGISVVQLANYYERLCNNLGEGASITLYRKDFTVLTRWPALENIVGKQNVSGTTYLVVNELKKTNDVIYTSGPRLSNLNIPTARLGAVRVLDRHPMIVNLTVTEDAFLGNWRHVVRYVSAIAIGSIIALLFSAILLYRVIRQKEKSATLLQDLTDQVPGVLFQLKKISGGNIFFTYANKTFKDTYHLKDEQLPIDSSKIFKFQHPDDKQRILESISESANKLRPWHEDYRLVLPNNEVVWRHGDAQPQKLSDGSILWHGYIYDITEQKLSESLLQNESEKNIALLRNDSDGIHILDSEGNLIEASDSFFAMLGYRRDEILGKNVSTWDAKFSAGELPNILKMQFASSHRIQFETRHRRKDGTIIDVEVSGFPLELIGRKVLFNSSRDITERKKSEESLLITASVFNSSQEAIFITDAENNIIDVNQAFTKVTGYGRNEVIGKNPKLLSSGRQDKSFYEALWQSLNTQKSWRGEVWNRRKSGEVYPEMLSISVLCNSEGEVLRHVAVFSDISHLKEHEAELSRVAYFDALTGVPNRVMLADRMKQATSQTTREQKLLAVCYLDLDGFKSINDDLGHEAGDDVLIEVAKRISDTIRGGDTVARLGGDEFVVLLLGLDQGEECVKTLERLLAILSEPINLKAKSVTVSASIGVSIYPLDEEDSDTLLRHADQAMYIAKQNGKNRFHIYDFELDKRARNQNEFLKSIRHALYNNQFELHYQPKINLRTKEMIGAEALIRWRHPERGVIPPSEFLRLIENTDLDIEIGEWVTASALAQMDLWQKNGINIEVSINISGYHLESNDFVGKLVHTLSKFPDRIFGKLKIEVLETVALKDINVVREIIGNCRELGITFALDDFGTGYSSLSYLSGLVSKKLF